VQPEDPDDRSRPGRDYPAPDRTRQEAQLRLILEDEYLGSRVEPGPLTWRETGIEYFVRRDVLLVEDDHTDRVRDVLRRRDRLPIEGAEYPDDLPADNDLEYGVRWIRLRRDSGVMEAMRDLVEEHGDEIADRVGPEFAVHIANTGGCCPADEPLPVAPGTPPDPPMAADRAAGTGIKVVVIDTGFDPAATALPWMRGVTGEPDPSVGGAAIPPYAGHGTFIAGVVRSMAPQAEVVVRAAFPTLGIVFEKDLVRTLRRVLRDDYPDVINLSAGTSTDRVTGPLLLNRFYERTFRHYKGVALVAAAGNDGHRKQFWPAAATWAVSVGALAPDWRTRASFSNFGGWVDVYAPGQHLVNAYRTGQYTYQEPPLIGQVAEFSGMASWSGTSFAAPVVAGLIAARMSQTGENGVDAAGALLAAARTVAQPGVGAVILPG
jgi:subtilisin family serine protease